MYFLWEKKIWGLLVHANLADMMLWYLVVARVLWLVARVKITHAKFLWYSKYGLGPFFSVSLWAPPTHTHTLYHLPAKICNIKALFNKPYDLRHHLLYIQTAVIQTAWNYTTNWIFSLFKSMRTALACKLKKLLHSIL